MDFASIRQIALPYCLQRQSDGRYALLNRKYKPLGFMTAEHVDYSSFPILFRFKNGLKPAQITKLSVHADPNPEAIYLYHDGSIPTDSDANMQAYLKRLALLAPLQTTQD